MEPYIPFAVVGLIISALGVLFFGALWVRKAVRNA